MRVLEGIQPDCVMYHFEEIAGIPHGSGNTKQISDHLVRFAEEHGLNVTQDALGNVIIRKPATAGCETAPGVILQGHMDMVCEKEPDADINMETDGLHLQVQKRSELPQFMTGSESDNMDIAVEETGSSKQGAISVLHTPDDIIITAKGTTLGGDDGIAVAFMLAILESDNIVHPALECVFTVDEEIGMLGAAGMDMSSLTGKYLLNIDSEDEGHLLVGCAGGCLTTITIPIERRKQSGTLMLLKIDGLQGGHSGLEIDKGRANADILLGRVLGDIQRFFDVRIDSEDEVFVSEVFGGTKDNAIPRSAAARLLLKNPVGVSGLREFLKQEEEVLKGEYASSEPGLRITLEEDTAPTYAYPKNKEKPTIGSRVITDASAIIRFLNAVPNGIQKMSDINPGLVDTSLNLGILQTTEDAVIASFCVRGNVNAEKEELMRHLEAVAAEYGGTCTHEGVYPAWEYAEDSHLRDVMCDCYRSQYDKEMIVETVHAGVECGLFADQIEGLEAVSFGPDLKNIHTTEESMDAASVERTWTLVLSVLKCLGETDK